MVGHAGFDGVSAVKLLEHDHQRLLIFVRELIDLPVQAVQLRIVDVGIAVGVVDKKGAWLQFDGELIGQGKDAAQKALAEKPELAKKIIEAIMVKRNGVPVAA